MLDTFADAFRSVHLGRVVIAPLLKAWLLLRTPSHIPVLGCLASDQVVIGLRPVTHVMRMVSCGGDLGAIGVLNDDLGAR